MSRLVAPRGFALVLALTLAVSPALAAQAETVHVTVVTDHAHPISGIGRLRDQGATVRVLYLDAPRHLLTRLNRDLPSDPQAAATVARRRVHTIGAARFKRAYAALQTALTYRLRRFPAIIFNQRAIVLGVTDLNEALARYRRWRDGARSEDHQ